MSRENLEKIVFLLLIGSLITLWGVIQISAIRSGDGNEVLCRILDIELKTAKTSGPDRNSCHLIIRMDRRVSYRITSIEAESSLLVELPHVDVSADLALRSLSNELVQHVWIQRSESGPVTVGLDLVSSQVLVIDRSEKSPRGTRLIDLELERKTLTASRASRTRVPNPGFPDFPPSATVAAAVPFSPESDKIVLTSKRSGAI